MQIRDRQTREAMTSTDLIREVVAKHLLFKIVADILKLRPPDPVAARVLIDAFDRGDAPPWLTAYLLGCLRAREGYATARAILVAAPGLLAESNAGVAMHAILKEEAFTDLQHLVKSAPALSAREGAAYGLQQLGDAAAAECVFAAAVGGRIRPNIAGGILARLPFDDGRLAELLVSAEERLWRVGVATAWSRGQRLHSSGRAPSQALAAAVRKLLLTPAVSLAPRTRRNLTDWFGAGSGNQ